MRPITVLYVKREVTPLPTCPTFGGATTPPGSSPRGRHHRFPTLPQSLDPILVALGGASYLLWSVGYFVVLWSSTGETAGDRVMRIRVIMADGGGPPRPLRALVRLGALILAVIPLGAGLLPILVDQRRRGAHDMLVGTVVVASPDPTPASTGAGVSGRRSP